MTTRTRKQTGFRLAAVAICVLTTTARVDAQDSIVSRSGDDPAGIRYSLPSRPTSERALEMGDWLRSTQQETDLLSRSWRELLSELARGRPERLSDECEDLERRVRGLDQEALFPVPDGSVEFFLKKSVINLEMALRSCRSERYFETVYRLEEAENAFRRVVAGIRYYKQTH